MLESWPSVQAPHDLSWSITTYITSISACGAKSVYARCNFSPKLVMCLSSVRLAAALCMGAEDTIESPSVTVQRSVCQAPSLLLETFFFLHIVWLVLQDGSRLPRELGI